MDPSGKPDEQMLGLAYGRLAEVYRQLGNTNEAIVNYTKALQYEPERSDFRHLLATQYQQQGRNEEAIDQLKNIALTEPESATGFGLLGEGYMAAGRLIEAEDAFQKCLKLGTDKNSQDLYWHERAWFGLAHIYAQQRQWESVLFYSLKAIPAIDSQQGFQYQLELDIEELLRNNPTKVKWFNAISEQYRLEGYFSQAEEIHEDALP